MAPRSRWLVLPVLAMLGIIGTLSGIRVVHFPAVQPRTANRGHPVSRAPQSQPMRSQLLPPPPPAMMSSNVRPCVGGIGGRTGITLRMGHPTDPSRSLGDIRLILRPEWSPSALYAESVAAQPEASQSSNVYRLEPGVLIQGSLRSLGVSANTDKQRAPKVMERGCAR